MSDYIFVANIPASDASNDKGIYILTNILNSFVIG
jgi:hypothetical protein